MTKWPPRLSEKARSVSCISALIGTIQANVALKETNIYLQLYGKCQLRDCYMQEKETPLNHYCVSQGDRFRFHQVREHQDLRSFYLIEHIASSAPLARGSLILKAARALGWITPKRGEAQRGTSAMRAYMQLAGCSFVYRDGSPARGEKH